MSCGLKNMGEGAKGLVIRSPYHNFPNLPIPYLILPWGRTRVCALGGQTGPPLHRVGRGI